MSKSAKRSYSTQSVPNPNRSSVTTTLRLAFASFRVPWKLLQASGAHPLAPLGSVVLSWLYMGNGQLYVAEGPIAAIPDLCRSSDDEVERFVVDSGVSVMTDSLHDDVSWVIGLKSNGQPSFPLDAPEAARR
jgi:hypothetical protein